MKHETINPKDYLIQKDIPFREQGGELIVKCLFNDCDHDSREDEGHLYIHAETGQYDCKKCDEQGNLITLAKHLGDDISSVLLKPITNKLTNVKNKTIKKKMNFDVALVDQYHRQLPERIKEYLNKRGIDDELINQFKLGYGQFYDKWWITIPIKDSDGNFLYLKLRQDPDDNQNYDKYKFYPSGAKASLYCFENLNNNDTIFITEGEFDCLMLIKNGIPAVSSTAGANTFKKEWPQYFKKVKNIYICYDKDKEGEKGANKVTQMLTDKLPGSLIFKTTLPDRMTDGKDITDYFIKYNGNPDELVNNLSKQVAGMKLIDTSQFKTLNSDDLLKVLGLTIKQDEENKLVTFLCQLSAYTESSQFNISFNAPSSTGKSYIPTEIAKLFPKEDVIEIAYCSPTAFFHDIGTFDKENKTYIIDLSRKILIFLDQPHVNLLERLRPLLSHDEKEINLKITDKSQKFGLRTKNVLIRGFPSVIFCTAGLKIDEQEATRFLLLSPETNQEKIRQAIQEKIKKESDKDMYQEQLDSDPARRQLKERILAIKQADIQEVKIADPNKIETEFLKRSDKLKPRHARDVGRLISIIKSLALLNLWFRERHGQTIIANNDDIVESFKIWDTISASQELNLPPYIYKVYQEVILPTWQEKNSDSDNKIGLSRNDILQGHYKVYGRMMADWMLRQQITPMLETAGLIMQESDSNDKRKMLIYPQKLT